MSRIVINEERCKGCALCTTACPFGLIRIADRFNAKGYRPAEFARANGGPAGDTTANTGAQSKECTGCANCAAMCPDVAITVYRTRSDGAVRTDAQAAERPATSRADKPAAAQHKRGSGS